MVDIEGCRHPGGECASASPRRHRIAWYSYVHSVNRSQNHLLDATKEALGDGKWGTPNNEIEALSAQAYKDLEAGNISNATFEVQFRYCIAKKALALAHPWERDDDTLLGVKEWDLERVNGLIKGIAERGM